MSPKQVRDGHGDGYTEHDGPVCMLVTVETVIPFGAPLPALETALYELRLLGFAEVVRYATLAMDIVEARAVLESRAVPVPKPWADSGE